MLNVNDINILSLPHRAGDAEMPTFQLIDIKNMSLEDGLSQPLLDEMKNHLAQNNQVMLFLNRRGYAPVLYCTQCNWMAECKRCDAKLVYHRSPPKLHCHHCDTRIDIPSRCGSCHDTSLEPIGVGTQRIEQILKKYIPTSANYSY